MASIEAGHNNALSVALRRGINDEDEALDQTEWDYSHFPLPAFNRLQYLSPTLCSPGLSFFLSAGIAGQRWKGDGAIVVGMISFRSFGSLPVVGSRARDLLDQIWCILGWWFFFVELWRPETIRSPHLRDL
jgi:hypothetical protein